MATTVANVLTYAQQLAQTDTNGIDSTNWGNNGSSFVNDALQNITRELLNRNIDAAQTQESKTDTNTTNPNTYAWPADMFMLKTVEVDFTGGGGGNYLQAQNIDVSNLQNSSFDWLRLNQSTGAPLYDNRGDTFEIFPVPRAAVTSGVRIFYYLTPTEFTAFSNNLSYPMTLDYRCLSARVASLYAASVGDLPMMQAMDTEYQRRVQQIISILAPGTQQPIQSNALRITGWEF